MKRFYLLVPILTAVAALFAGTASAADEKEDILARFDRELLIVMSGFAEARESGVSSTFRQDYLNTFDKFIQDANTLQKIVTELEIGEDLNIATHARNLRSAFQAPASQPQPTAASSSKTSNQKNRTSGSSSSSKENANDPLARMTGRSLSEHGEDVMTSSVYSATSYRMTAGFSFRMAGNAVQTLSSLGFGVRNGKYSVSPRYRRILPYLELKRQVEYYNASYEHFDSLIEIGPWRNDFEKRLNRMAKLAAQVQPVYRAYFPDKTGSVTAEADRLSRVYRKFVEYVRAVEQANAQASRLTQKTSAFDQIRTSNIPDKGLILKEFDAADVYFARFFADMDSIDWTVNPFSESGPAQDDAVKPSAKDDMIKLPAKSSD